MRAIISKRDGQMLVEAMVALGIVVVGLLGLMDLLSTSIGYNKVVGDQYIGAYLASEGVEMVKNIIDNDVAYGRPFNNSFRDGRIYELGYKGPEGSWTIDKTEYNANNPTGRYLKFDDATKKYNYESGNDTVFKRLIEIRYGSPGGVNGNEIIVNSKTSWTTKGGASMDINVEDHFFNWRN